MGDWQEVSVTTNSLAADLVSEALMRLGAKGTQIIDHADVPDPSVPSGHWELIDPGLIQAMPEDVVVKAWFSEESDLAALRESLHSLPGIAGFDLGGLQLSIDSVQEKDWAEYWKRFYKPFRLGERLVVVPSWEDYRPLPEDLVLHLDPGMAFGTGTHETTALCVELLERHYRGGTVLDVGTGSGILAIAAARLGAQDVLAVDIDPVAVRVTKENIGRNGLTSQVTALQGDLVQGIQGRHDLAVANILADVIILLGGPMLRHLKPGGTFICSGIIRDRAEDVITALTELGYTLLEDRRQGEWAAFAWRAPA